MVKNQPIAESVPENKFPATSPNFTSEFDIEKVFYLILRKWPIILLTTILGYFASNLYLRYATPTYSAIMRLLVKDTRSSSGMSETAIFEDLGILNTTRNLDNEIQIIKTIYLMEEVVKRLNLQYSYQSHGRLKTNDLYKNSPISVLAWVPQDSTLMRVFEFEVSPEGKNMFSLVFLDKVYKGQFGQAVKLPVGVITLGTSDFQNQRKFTKESNITIRVSPVSIAATKYNKQLNVSINEKTRSTVLELTFTDPVSERASDILRNLMEVYNESEITDKNRIYENTLSFIDERLQILGTELKEVEGNVASFKSQKGAVDLFSEGSLLLSESSVSNKEIAALNAEIEIASAIRSKLIADPGKFEIVPTSESLTTPSLFGLLENFNTLVLEREKFISTLGAKHPNITLIEKQLSNLRLNIIENINIAEKQLMVKKNSLLNRDRMISGKIRTLPDTEKQLLEIQRQQAIKQQLYLYLLQKREETALSLNVTVANNRIIEPVRLQGQVAPKPRQIRLMGVSIGFLLPIFIVLFLQALNKKVMIEDHIKEETASTILGTIPYSGQKGHIIIGEKKRSASAEMFRLMRANMQFIGEGVHNRLIAVTSSVSGEGKSFVTLNLGLTLALAGKKILIIELDMRKPKLASYLGHKKGSGKGLTEYLVDETVSLDKIIYQSMHNDNLFYIPCGPIPPNPSELFLSEKLHKLFQKLKIEYDFIFIDTPPIGLVSDALLLSPVLDATFYIVRQNLTEKRQLRIIEDIRANGKMPRVYVIFNGIRFGAGGYGYGGSYGYGYGHNYGYGYGYYSDDQKQKSYFTRIKEYIFPGSS